MELSIQERLKDLRVERGLTLEQLAEKTHLSKSALGSYEGDNFKDISHYALIELAKFYEVTVDYLLGRSQTRNHPNADLADLHLSDDMISVDEKIKREAEVLLNQMGLTMTAAINIFLKRIILEQDITFEVSTRIPNATIKAAMDEFEEMKKNPETYKRYPNFRAAKEANGK